MGFPISNSQCSIVDSQPSASFGGRQSASGNMKGFTFVEVLFAIIILGIGMIMIAGILPVAIKQQADTRDEMTAKAVCEAGYAYLATIAQTKPESFVPTNLSDAVATTPQLNFGSIRPLRALLNIDQDTSRKTVEDDAGKVVPLNYEVSSDNNLSGNAANPGPYRPFDAIVNSRVSSLDPQYQYLAFYRRDQNAAALRLIILATKLQNTEAVKSYGVDAASSENTLQREFINDHNGPFLCEVEVQNQTLEPDRIFIKNSASNPPTPGILGDGTYIVIADSRAGRDGDDPGRPFRNNGRVFQLGQQRTDVPLPGANWTAWDLSSSHDLPIASVGPDGLENTSDDVVDGSMDSTGSYTVDGSPVNGTTAQAWVIGRGLYNPTADASNSNKYLGRTQDVGILIADVPLR